MKASVQESHVSTSINLKAPQQFCDPLMIQQNPNREIPQDIAHTVNGLRAVATLELRNRNYKRAESLYMRELEIITQKEKEKHASFHKGATYYNLGLSQLLQNRGEDALRHIFQAYVEDIFNVSLSKEDEADDAPARRTLSDFGISDENLKPIKLHARELKKDPQKWVTIDSIAFAAQYIKAILEKAKIPLIETRPTLEKLRDVGQLPDKKTSVFIGGPFKIAAYLRELRRVLLQVRPKYIPYMSLDFTIEDERTHDDCMKILSNCGHAIFDVSTEAGQYAEIEHARMKNIPALLLFSATDEKDKTKPPIPAVIRTVGFPIKGFCYLNELEEIIKDFLPEQP